MNRRTFLHAGLMGVAALTQSCAHRATNTRLAGLPINQAFDQEMEAFMAARNVPGGALAVVKDRRLVYARGYGWADRERKIPATEDSLFRIASISKPVTAVAVLQLAEQGRLDPEAHVFKLLPLDKYLPKGSTLDERWPRITLRQLLQHTGGWDRDKSGDPMFRSTEICEALGKTSGPAIPWDVIQHMLGRRLDFDPGTRYAYSNFGYCLLGRVIEQISGTSYEQFVRDKVLAPAGIRRMKIGASLEDRRSAGEVRYYTRDEELTESVFPPAKTKVPLPYGGFHLEAMDAHGGWIASAIDLARFAAALDGPQHSPLLKPASFTAMYAPPPPPAWRKADGSLGSAYYGCGWMVRPTGRTGGANYWHTGSLPGTNTLLMRLANGLSIAALFNLRSEDEKLPDTEIDPALHRAAGRVAAWPEKDLFANHPPILE